MRMDIESSKNRAEANKLSFGGEWRVVIAGDRIYVQMIGEAQLPKGGKVVYETTGEEK